VQWAIPALPIIENKPFRVLLVSYNLPVTPPVLHSSHHHVMMGSCEICKRNENPLIKQ